jgi:hypothetical protein
VTITPDHGSVHRPVFTVHWLGRVYVVCTADVRMSSSARVFLQPSTSVKPPKSVARSYVAACDVGAMRRGSNVSALLGSDDVEDDWEGETGALAARCVW